MSPGGLVREDEDMGVPHMVAAERPGADAAEQGLFWLHALVLAAVIVALTAQKVRSAGLLSVSGLCEQEAASLAAFQRRYLGPYLLATFADFIQGPYQFKVYLTYGLTEGQIGVLYIAGFGSSLIIGTWVAAWADTIGRRAGCLIYCVSYSLSCLTKNSPVFGVLMVGRLLGGLATSLLFATFEAWCVTAATASGLTSRSLGAVFGNAGFLNGLTAIVASLVGHALVVLGGSFICPFNFVPVVLAACAYLMLRDWDENYGSDGAAPDCEKPADDDAKAAGGLAAGLRMVSSDIRLPLLGLIGSLFDAALYIFIFLWTLGLESRSVAPDHLPHGVVFAVFMGWCMAGALAIEWLLSREGSGGTGSRARRVVGVLLWVAALSLIPPTFRQSTFLQVFTGFCVFEFCTGAYQPAVALLRAVHLKEEGRAAATALFRVPTNLAVCLVLLQTEALSERTKFLLCVGLLLVGVGAHALFTVKVTRAGPLDDVLVSGEADSPTASERRYHSETLSARKSRFPSAHDEDGPWSPQTGVSKAVPSSQFV